jgi:two-component system response regulator AtoC
MLSSLSAQRQEILEAIFDQLSDALFLYDKNLHIVGVNQSAARLFHMSAEEMIGKRCQELFRRADCEPSGDSQHGVDKSSWLASGTTSLYTNHGRERMAVVRTAQLLDEAGTLEGMVATVKDITEEASPAQRQIIAESPAMRELLDFVRRVAISNATSILIEGENGTGKDLIAKTLHYQSTRQTEPFVAINCAAIPATLLESELFGYEKGAFTDARIRKLGLFELADKGTLFLDEIGELPHSLQVKLLRVLENQSFRRLGGLRDITINVRVIAATNKNLQNAVREGAFRQDLYYRLNVIQLTVPPLREHPQDILPLARFFVEHYNQKFKQQIEGISPGAEDLLLTHDWPGNVRELRNAIERAMILEDTASIRPSSLPIALYPTESSFAAAAGANASLIIGRGISLVEHERRLMVQALEKTGGNQSRSAVLLGITRDKFRYKMKKFNLR